MNKILIVLSGMFLAANVSAACQTKHFNGEWVGYQIAITPKDGIIPNAEHTGRCVLTVEDGTGMVECNMTLNGGIMPSGTLDANVYPDCSVDMTWMLDNGLIVNFDMQLSKNKQSYIGSFVAETGNGDTVVRGTTSGIQL